MRWIQNNASKVVEPEGVVKPRGESFVRNPLYRYPRNIDCYCGSHVKFKKCCLQTMPTYVTVREARMSIDYLAYVEETLGKGI